MSRLTRQLTPDETRAFVGGMAAKRRGELNPPETLDRSLWWAWRNGWRRVGRGGPPRWLGHRTRNSHSLAEAVHVVRTEVETLDEALDVLVQRARTLKVNATKGHPLNPRSLKQKLAGAKMAQRTKAKYEKAVAARDLSIREREARSLDRVNEAIKLLCLAVEDISAACALHAHTPGISQAGLVQIIKKLCFLTKQQVPALRASRQPGQEAHNRQGDQL